MINLEKYEKKKKSEKDTFNFRRKIKKIAILISWIISISLIGLFGEHSVFFQFLFFFISLFSFVLSTEFQNIMANERNDDSSTHKNEGKISYLFGASVFFIFIYSGFWLAFFTFLGTASGNPIELYSFLDSLFYFSTCIFSFLGFLTIQGGYKGLLDDEDRYNHHYRDLDIKNIEGEINNINDIPSIECYEHISIINSYSYSLALIKNKKNEFIKKNGTDVFTNYKIKNLEEQEMNLNDFEIENI